MTITEHEPRTLVFGAEIAGRRQIRSRRFDR